MSATITTSNGRILYGEDAIKQIIGTVVSESYGIVGMSAKGDGIVELLKRDSVSRGVKVNLDSDQVNADLYVIVKYGVSIKTVAENIIDNVKFTLEDLTGLKAGCINVIVQGIRL